MSTTPLPRRICYSAPAAFRDGFRDGLPSVINYALVSSGNSVRAHTGEFTMAAAGRRAVPGITVQPF